jgi:hypothetical protein
MTFSKVLDFINSNYIPGLVQHYDRLEPNPWQKAFDDMERVAVLQDQALLQAGVDRFYSEVKRLIEAYKALSVFNPKSDHRDAFYMGEVDRVSDWHSRKHKYCVKCQSKDNLTLAKNPKDDLNVIIVCKPCLQKAG